MDIINSFLTYLKAEGKRKNTVKTYFYTINQFYSYIKKDLKNITQEKVELYLSKFNNRNQTQNLKKNAINKFLNFLFERGYIKKPIKIKIKTITISEPEYLSLSEQEKFLNVLKNARIRDYTLFTIMLYTGMRISEVLNIRFKDIQEDHIKIYDSKTGPGKVYLRKKLIPIIENYLSSFNPPLKENDYIFQSNRKIRMTERMVQLLIKKYLRLADIKKHITPHSLRHTFAARLRQSGSDIEIIQRTLRHKHIQSTLRYSHIQDDDLKNAIEKSLNLKK